MLVVRGSINPKGLCTVALGYHTHIAVSHLGVAAAASIADLTADNLVATVRGGGVVGRIGGVRKLGVLARALNNTQKAEEYKADEGDFHHRDQCYEAYL